jgi:hypothetical protein
MSAVADTVSPAPRTDTVRSIDELDAAICRLASRIHAETYQNAGADPRVRRPARLGEVELPELCGVVVLAVRDFAFRSARKVTNSSGVARSAVDLTRVSRRPAVVHESAGTDARGGAARRGRARALRARCDSAAGRGALPTDSQRATGFDSDARRAWETRSLSAWRDAKRGTLCLRVELPLEVGELVMKAIEKALEKDAVSEVVAETSKSSFQSQQADALVAIVRTYLEGAVTDSTAGSASSADRYQVVVHVDEAALHGGIGRALWSRDRHCTFPGCHRTRFVQAHHVDHRIDGGETGVDNLVLLCSYHHRLLHEGGYRIRRDYQGEHYFVRADGRAIPRCGYRADDCIDDDAGPDPSVEVREPRGVYRLNTERAAFAT